MALRIAHNLWAINQLLLKLNNYNLNNLTLRNYNLNTYFNTTVIGEFVEGFHGVTEATTRDILGY